MLTTDSRRVTAAPLRWRVASAEPRGAAMDLKAAAEIANNLATSAAVAVGGTWAYFKFVRGRTFKHRAELSVSAQTIEVGQARFLSVTATLKNNGLSKLPLNDRMKALRLCSLSTSTPPVVEPASWTHLLTTRLFEQHMWLEPLEVVSDRLLFVLPLPSTGVDGSPTAYEVEAIVGSSPALITRKKTRWRARNILVLSGAESPAGRTDLGLDQQIAGE